MEHKQSGLRALFEKYREIIMYCVFGIVTTVVSWLVYSVFMLILPFDVDTRITLFGKAFDFNINILVSNIISWILAVAVAFVTNKLWVFNSKSWEPSLVRKEALTFIGGRALTGILEILAVPFLEGIGFDMVLFGVAGLPAKILVSIAIVILNYILSKFISFRSKGETAED